METRSKTNLKKSAKGGARQGRSRKRSNLKTELSHPKPAGKDGSHTSLTLSECSCDPDVSDSKTTLVTRRRSFPEDHVTPQMHRRSSSEGAPIHVPTRTNRKKQFHLRCFSVDSQGNRHDSMNINNSNHTSGRPTVTAASIRNLDFHGCTGFANIYKLWQRGRLCDIIFRADSATFPAHRLVVASACDKLKMDAESFHSPKVIEYNISNVSAGVMADVVKYFYTSIIEVNEHNVCEMLDVSQQLGISKIHDSCILLLKKLTVSNVLRNLSIAKEFQLNDLHKAATNYIRRNFEAVTTTVIFRDLGVGCLFDMLLDSVHSDTSELRLFHAFKRWLLHDKVKRMQYAVTLMSLVRFEDIAPHVIVSEIESVQDIFSIPECKEFLYQTFRHFAWLQRDCPCQLEKGETETVAVNKAS